jgi:hypothetical protein
MFPPQILDTVLTLRFWGFETHASGLPAVVAVVVIAGLFIFARRRRS